MVKTPVDETAHTTVFKPMPLRMLRFDCLNELITFQEVSWRLAERVLDFRRI